MTSAAADSQRLYLDRAHGEGAVAPALIEIAGKSNLHIAEAATPITAQSLEGTRLLYLRAPTEEFTSEERAAIILYVQNGGSLLLVLDEEQRQSLAKTQVNEILRPFGLSLTADTEYRHNCGAIAKAGEINKQDRELPYSGGRSVEGGTPFAWQLDADGQPAQPFAAYKKVEGGGRIIVMGEGMASLFLGTTGDVRLTGVPRDPGRTTYWGKDSVVFMQEVVTWLATR